MKASQILAFALFFLISASGANASPHWYTSKKFWIPFAVDAAAAVADYHSAQVGFAHGEHENDPVFGSSQPSMARMTTIGLTADFALSYTGYRMSESKHKILRDFYWLPASADAEEHQYYAVRNLYEPRTHPPVLSHASAVKP
jgi:hypothetical protein